VAQQIAVVIFGESRWGKSTRSASGIKFSSGSSSEARVFGDELADGEAVNVA
jgi:hypothetical protein